MKKIKTFEEFLNEGLDDVENAGLYDDMADLLSQANILVCTYKGEDPNEYTISNPDEAIDCLDEIEEGHELYHQAQELIDNIAALDDDIDSIDAKEYFSKLEKVDRSAFSNDEEGELFYKAAKKLRKEKKKEDKKFIKNTAKKRLIKKQKKNQDN